MFNRMEPGIKVILEGYLILMVLAFTCKSYMGRGENESDGVGEDEGGSKVWP